MKTMLSIAVCAAAALALADDPNGTSDVTIADIGITKVTSSTKETALAVSYQDFDSNQVTISNLVKTTNLTPGDQLAIFSETRGEYETFTLVNGAWVKNDKKFVLGPTGLVQDDAAAPNKTVPVGRGIWLIRNNEYVPGTSFDVYIYGALVTNKIYQLTQGWNLIGNPLQSAVAITAEVVSQTAGDQILYRGTNYSYNATRGWYYSQNGKKVWGDPTIAAGDGFWYNNKSSDPKQVSWVEPTSGD